MKICYIDVETTGLYPYKHGVIQIAGVIETFEDGLVEGFNYAVAPFEFDGVEAAALEVNKTTLEEAMSRPKPQEVFGKFKAMLERYVSPYDKKDKFHFVGYNARFDDDHLRGWFKKNKSNFYGSYFWTPVIDVMALAGNLCIGCRHELDNFRLATVCQHFGITLDESRLHDANYDIEITRQLFYLVNGGGLCPTNLKQLLSTSPISRSPIGLAQKPATPQT